jgi:hypothetical protein
MERWRLCAGMSSGGFLMEKKIFVSVGKDGSSAQEAFVEAIEARLIAEGFFPCTVGRNTWTAGKPLEKVMELMGECVGAVVIALERTYFPAGVERRGAARETQLQNIRMPTPFNQVEAALAYAHGRPLLVICEEGLREEALLERNNDWCVQRIAPNAASLSTKEFNGVLAAWKDDVVKKKGRRKNLPGPDGTIIDWVGSLKPSQAWSMGGALAVVIGGAFALGAKLAGGG